MAILVDPAIWRWRGRRWAHLVSDTSHDELHAFAERLGLRREWFQGDHYDVPDAVRTEALLLGAVATPSGELVRRLRAAGLRCPPAWCGGERRGRRDARRWPGATQLAGRARRVGRAGARRRSGVAQLVGLGVGHADVAGRAVPAGLQ